MFSQEVFQRTIKVKCTECEKQGNNIGKFCCSAFLIFLSFLSQDHLNKFHKGSMCGSDQNLAANYNKLEEVCRM